MGSLPFHPPLLVAACSIAVWITLLLAESSARAPSLHPRPPTKRPLVLGLQHRDFSEQLAPNLSPAQRVESAVRRSQSRKERIERMIRDAGEGNSTTWEVSIKGRKEAGIKERPQRVNAGLTTGRPDSRKDDEVEAAGRITGLKGTTSDRMRGGRRRWEHSADAGKEAADSASRVAARNKTTKGGVSSSRGISGWYSLEMERGDGAFLTSVHIGTPPKEVMLILDTGSDLVWQQCQPCEACYEQPDEPIFDPSVSSTFKRSSCSDALCQALLPSACTHNNGSCQYTYMYGDTSFTSGELAYDTLSLFDVLGQGDQKVKGFAFGCGYISRGASFAGADGILGIGQGPLSLASQMSAPCFSYCLSSSSSSHMSPLLLGERDQSFLHVDKSFSVQVTSFLKNKYLSTFYYLNLIGISVDNDRLVIPQESFTLKDNGSGGMIIDSGTTITYLEQHSYEVVINSVKEKVKNQLQIRQPMFGLDLCFLPLNESTLPTLTFHFDGADMSFPPSNLFFEVAGIYCFALGKSHDISILGNMQQQNYQMFYDLRGQQLTFMRTSCSQLLT